MRLFVLLVAFLAHGLTTADLAARYKHGPGTPPLTVEGPEIDYMSAPDHDVMRFGRRVVYNTLGMRAEGLPDAASDPVVMVSGDSVLNGGSQTDQSELAATRLAAPDAILAMKPMAENADASFCVMSHRTLSERDKHEEGSAVLLGFLQKNAIRFVEDIHINAAGQVGPADAIFGCFDLV